MPPAPRYTLICTVGTSLFYPNLSRLARDHTDRTCRALALAYEAKDWPQVSAELHRLEPSEPICGAEINSVEDLLNNSYVEKGNLHLLFSDTLDGKAIAEVLKNYFDVCGWQVDIHRINDLRDDNPKIFRTRGLRNLAKEFGKRVRESGIDFCAINATGGYKAQIAIAVLMGQAMGIPVYYKHERFDAVIPFPPMPIALDFSLWQKASGMFMVLSRPDACEPVKRFSEDWDERFEPLVNRETIDGEQYLELSATGEIFHETFRTRFRQLEYTGLPRDATAVEKKNPSLGNHGYGKALVAIKRHLMTLTEEKPYVRYCHSTYWNPDLPDSSRFRQSVRDIEGIYSNGSWCVKFRVFTTAEDEDNFGPIVADLNEWQTTQ